MADESKPIHLLHPIPIKDESGKIISYMGEMTVGRLKLKHIELLPPQMFTKKAGDKTDMAVLIPVLPKLIAGLTNVSIEIVKEMDFEDMQQFAEVLGDFFGNTQA